MSGGHGEAATAGKMGGETRAPALRPGVSATEGGAQEGQVRPTHEQGEQGPRVAEGAGKLLWQSRRMHTNLTDVLSMRLRTQRHGQFESERIGKDTSQTVTGREPEWLR